MDKCLLITHPGVEVTWEKGQKGWTEKGFRREITYAEWAGQVWGPGPGVASGLGELPQPGRAQVPGVHAEWRLYHLVCGFPMEACCVSSWRNCSALGSGALSTSASERTAGVKVSLIGGSIECALSLSFKSSLSWVLPSWALEANWQRVKGLHLLRVSYLGSDVFLMYLKNVKWKVGVTHNLEYFMCRHMFLL